MLVPPRDPQGHSRRLCLNCIGSSAVENIRHMEDLTAPDHRYEPSLHSMVPSRSARATAPARSRTPYLAKMWSK
jgi:hypothetical protein